MSEIFETAKAIVRIHAHETYQQARAANWPRPTCVVCHAPTAYDREFRGAGLCQSCYNEEPLFIQKRSPLPCLLPKP